MYCDNGIELSIKLSKFSLSVLTYESGSHPSGRKTKDSCISSFNSVRQFVMAFHAADLPAVSPSKQNMMLLVYLFILLK